MAKLCVTLLTDGYDDRDNDSSDVDDVDKDDEDSSDEEDTYFLMIDRRLWNVENSKMTW
jgi:hypothetical protein